LAALGLLMELGCRRSSVAPPPLSPSSSTAITDAGTMDAAMDAGPPADAGPPPILSARLTAVVDGGPPAAEIDGGADDAGAQRTSSIDLSMPDASVPDWAILTFTATTPLDDFRARLLGSDGQLVANHAETWIADGGTQVQLAPAPRWPARGCCRFVVDGQSERLPIGAGSRFLPFEVDFSVAADPDRPQPARTARRHRRHRR
jgi:hypothetical protein